MNRAWKIAVREYLSLLRTPGFWISLCVTPAMIAFLSLGGPKALESTAPASRVMVIDLTGSGLGAVVNGAFAGRDSPGRLVAPLPVAGPPGAAQLLAVRVAASPRAPDALEMGVLAEGPATAIRLKVWSRGFGDPVALAAVEQAAAARMRTARLAIRGLPPSLLKDLDDATPAIEHMSASPETAPQISPVAQTGATLASPPHPPSQTAAAAQGVAMASALLLWAMILTGAGLLLNSVIEEKSGRILEVLMSCASIPEILAGKIAGMAALSGTTLGVWVVFGVGIASRGHPHLIDTVLAGAAAHGLIVFFLLFFLLGYLMYAAVFAAIGAFCETPREAQALLGPLMLLMSVPILFLSLSMQRPDAPIIALLSWLPPFTPFLMTARVAAGLPAWQACLALAMMAATSTIVVWLAGRAFNAGALSGGKLDLRAFIGRRLKTV